jgi:tetratricopeptide (TPR) repeat protein
MDFYAVLDQVVDLLRSRQRTTYRTLKRQFNLDDAALEDLKEELLFALPHLPEQRDTREQAIDLRLALRTALMLSGDWGRTLAALREAEALAAALDDPRRLGQVSVVLSRYFYAMGVYDQAIATAQRALALATAGGDVTLHALANLSLGQASHAHGDYRRAIDCCRQTMAFLDGARRRERFGQVFLPAVQCQVRLAWCHAELGTFAEGRAFGEEGLRIAEAVAHPASLMQACWGSGLLSLHQGDLPRAFPLLERAVGICQDADLPVYFPWFAPALGTAYALGGRVADAVSLLTRAMEWTTATEMTVPQVPCSLPLGEAQVLAGRLEEAQALAERTLALTCERQQRSYQAYTLRLLGEIAAHRDPPDVTLGEVHYQQALTLVDELGMRPLQAHCHLGLGRLYARVEQREQARVELSTAIALYRSMEMTLWLPQAEATLAQVEAR